MSKVITVINMKGGVGKTTMAVNISYALARFHKKRVLIVDIDPQFNATQYLVDQETILDHFKNKKTVYDILMPNKDAGISLTSKRKPSTTVATNVNDYIINLYKYDAGGILDLIPSSLKLINFETNKRGTENLLHKFLDSKCKSYDFIIIDCPPTLSLLTLSAYLASQYYIIPIKPDYLSALGLPLLQRGLEEYEELYGHSLELLGVVFTMVNNRTNITFDIMEGISDGDWDCLDNYSSHSVKVAESVKSLDEFYRYAKNDAYTKEFKLITKEILDKIP